MIIRGFFCLHNILSSCKLQDRFKVGFLRGYTHDVGGNISPRTSEMTVAEDEVTPSLMLTAIKNKSPWINYGFYFSIPKS